MEFRSFQEIPSVSALGNVIEGCNKIKILSGSGTGFSLGHRSGDYILRARSIFSTYRAWLAHRTLIYSATHSLRRELVQSAELGRWLPSGNQRQK